MDQGANEFLMGGGIASLSFDRNKGYVMGQTIHRGKLLEGKTMQQRDINSGEPKFWQDGKPVMQLVLTLQTDIRDPQDPDDDGKRNLYVSSPNMRTAIRDAVKTSGAQEMKLGGELAICWVAEGEQKNKAHNPPKIYKAMWTPPDPAVDFLGLGSAPANATPNPFADGSQMPPQTQVPQGVHPAQHFANLVQQGGAPVVRPAPAPNPFAAPAGQPGPIANIPAQVAQQTLPLAQAAQQAAASAANPFVQQVQAEQPQVSTPVSNIPRPPTVPEEMWATLSEVQKQGIAAMAASMVAPPAQPGGQPAAAPAQGGYANEPPF